MPRTSPRHLPELAALVLALITTILTAVPVVAKPKPSRVVIVVEIMHSTSDAAETATLIANLTDVVVPEAQRRHAYVRVEAVVGRVATRPTLLGEATFDPASAGNNDNPDVVRAFLAKQQTALIDSTVKRLKTIRASKVSDPVGALRRMADVFAQSPGATHIGVLLGDAISTTDGCNFSALLGGDTPDWAGVETACIGRHAISLTGSEIWAGGIGVDIDGRIDPEPVARRGAGRAQLRAGFGYRVSRLRCCWRAWRSSSGSAGGWLVIAMAVSGRMNLTGPAGSPSSRHCRSWRRWWW